MVPFYSLRMRNKNLTLTVPLQHKLNNQQLGWLSENSGVHVRAAHRVRREQCLAAAGRGPGGAVGLRLERDRQRVEVHARQRVRGRCARVVGDPDVARGADAGGCQVELVMKDVHTLSDEPTRLARWVELARQAVEEIAG